LLVFTACGDSTGPDEMNIDPVAAASSLESVVDQFIDGNDGLQSMNVLNAAIFDALSGPSLSVTPLDLLPRTADGALLGSARRIQASIAGGIDTPPSIPVGALGVWVYDPVQERYVLDPERASEAPPNTARFILYAVNPLSGEVFPSMPIGYLDLTDNSQLPAIGIGMTGVLGEVTFLDLEVTGTFSRTISQANLQMDFGGFLSDGTDQLDIDLGVAAQSTATTVEIDVDFSLAFADLTASFSIAQLLSETALDSDITVTFTDGTDRIVFQVGVEASDALPVETVVDGSGVSYNGRMVARISGTLSQPSITNAAGDPLSDEELQALGRLFDGMANLFTVFDGFLTFGIILLGAGVA
jgi:hypothetical protein